MVIRQVRIGSMNNIHQYDDGSYPSAIDSDNQPIEIGQAVGGTQAVRQDQLPTLANVVSAAANITDNAIVRGDGGAKGVQGSLVTIDDAGNVDIPTGQGLQVNSTQVVTDQQAAESDAGAVSAITMTAGADTIDITSVDADLATLVTEINAIRTTLNNLLAKLRTHGLIDT